MGDDALSYDDLPVTVGTIKTVGDIYPSGADRTAQRMITSAGQAPLIDTDDTGAPGIDPVTGAALDNAQIGVGDPYADFIRHGLYNAEFQLKPANPGVRIDDDNQLPYWSSFYGDSTGGTVISRQQITWTQMSTAAISSATYYNEVGAAVTFSFPTGMELRDYAWISQNIPLRQSPLGLAAVMPQVSYRSTTADANVNVSLELRVYDASGAAALISDSSTLAASTAKWLRITPTDLLGSAADAAYANIRLSVNALGGTASPGSVTFFSPRAYPAAQTIAMSYAGTAVAEAAYASMSVSSDGFMQATSDLNTTSIFGVQLVGIPFSLVNIAQNATTDMQMWGDTALALGTPRIASPWSGSIIGVSYRLSAIPTNGGASALQIRATVGGSNVWVAHTLAGSGASATGEARQAIGTDTFTAGQQLGLDVVTSSTYQPAGTADLACILWLAINLTSP